MLQLQRESRRESCWRACDAPSVLLPNPPLQRTGLRPAAERQYRSTGMTKSHDDRAGDLHEFQFGSDISRFVADLNTSKTVMHDKPIVVKGESEGTQVDIAIQWNDSYQHAIYCFTNNTR